MLSEDAFHMIKIVFSYEVALFMNMRDGSTKRFKNKRKQ